MLRLILCLFFLTWSAAPVAVLGFAKPVERMGNTEVGPLSPVFSRLVSGDGEQLASLSSAILERSRLTSLAITLKNAFLLYGFDHVDTDDLVSGRDGWLYYKQQFYPVPCEDRLRGNFYHFSANKAATLRAFAETVGMDVLYSVSPNKATVHPEGLTEAMASVVGCNLETQSELRDSFRSRLPEVMFHDDVMHKGAATGDIFFFKKNTHWNKIGYILAVRQLRGWFGEEALPPITVSTSDTEKRVMSTTKNMLLLDYVEEAPLPDSRSVNVILDRPIQSPGRSVIVYDSFYDFYPETKTVFGSNAELFYMNEDEQMARLPSALSSIPDKLVFNSVERASAIRFLGQLGADGPYMKPILAENMRRAEEICDFAPDLARLAFDNISLQNFEEIDGGFRSTTGDPIFVLTLPEQGEGHVCLRMRFASSKAGHLQLHFPPLEGQSSGALWEGGRHLLLNVSEGENVYELILPRFRENKVVRVDPVQEAGVFISGAEFWSTAVAPKSDQTAVTSP